MSSPQYGRMFLNLGLAFVAVTASAVCAQLVLGWPYSAAIIAGAFGALLNMLAMSLDHKTMDLRPEMARDVSVHQIAYLCARLWIGAGSGFCVLAFFGPSLDLHHPVAAATEADSAVAGARTVALGLIAGYSISVLDRFAKVLEGNISKP